MIYKIKMTPLKDREDHIKAVGILSMGEIRVRNLTLMESKEGKLFLSMPNRDTNKTDENGKKIYEEICHPITKEMRIELEQAAIESYKEGHQVTLSENKEGSLLVSSEAFDYPFYNRVGKAQLTINDNFVIKNIFVNKKNDGSLYVTFPNYKTNKTAKNGSAVYSEIISTDSGFRKKVVEAILDEYKLSEIEKESSRLSIKRRLEDGKAKVTTEDKKPEDRPLLTPKNIGRY